MSRGTQKFITHRGKQVMSLNIGGDIYVDGQRKLSTTIVAEDVDIAQPTDPSHCAIAESLRRQHGVEKVSVGATIVAVQRKGSKVIERYVLKPNDRAMIREFDKQGAFPCGYRVTLEPPPESRRIGARKGEKPGTNVRSGEGRKDVTAKHKRQQPTRHFAKAS
jgi:hypothetical protein